MPVAGKFPSPKKITLDFTPENKNACPIFAGRLIRGVKNGPAPKWVQDRLQGGGHEIHLRPGGRHQSDCPRIAAARCMSSTPTS